MGRECAHHACHARGRVGSGSPERSRRRERPILHERPRADKRPRAGKRERQGLVAGRSPASPRDGGALVPPGLASLHMPPQEALADQKRDWEEIAGEDALWAILSYTDRKFGAWDREEFFRTGEEEIGELMLRARELDRPGGRARALDFGCGVGRLTRALSEHFESCLGLDISETMVNGARELNADRPGCEFEVNARPD